MSWGETARLVDLLRHEPPVAQRRSLEQVVDAQILAQALGSGAAVGMGLPAVYGAVRLISSTIVQLPLTLDPGDGTRADLPRWMRYPRSLGGRWDQGDLVQHLVSSMALYGAAWLLVTRIGDGWWLDPLHPAQVTMRTAETVTADGHRLRYPAYQLDGRDVEQLPDTMPTGGSFLLHVPYQVTPDHPEGVGPLQSARLALEGYAATERHASTLFDGGTYSGGRLETDQDITNATATHYQDTWIANRKTGKLPVLGTGLKYVNDVISAADAQWIEARQFSQAQIWLMYGIPPDYMGATMTGGGSSLSYSNAQDNDRRFRRNCLASFTQQAEEGLSRLLPRGRNESEDQRIEFDYSTWEGETSGASATTGAA